MENKKKKRKTNKLPDEKFSPWDEQQEQEEDDGAYEVEHAGPT